MHHSDDLLHSILLPPPPPRLPLLLPSLLHSPLQTLQYLFIASIAVLSFIYLLLGRWDYIISQADSKPQVDGLRRFPSTAHLMGGRAAANSEVKIVEGDIGEREVLAD